MLSQITFADTSRTNADKTKDSRHQSKHKSSKKKKRSKDDPRDAGRRSVSPVIDEQLPSQASQPARSADEMCVHKLQAAAPAEDIKVQQAQKMDNLLHSISASVSAKPIAGSTPQHVGPSGTKAVAPQLQEVSGRSSGLVGDGGSQWRRRMQRRATVRATERGEELPKVQGRHLHAMSLAKHGQGVAQYDFTGARDTMRRPSQDVASAFGQARSSDHRKQHHQPRASMRQDSFAHAANDSDEATGAEHLPQSRRKEAAQEQAVGKGTADTTPHSQDIASGGANMSAAAQLRARLRGEPMPVAVLDKAPPGETQRQQGSIQRLENRRGPKHLQRFSGGERQLYFEDDDMHSTAALAKNARLGVDLHDMDEAMARNIVSKRKFRAQDLDVDDEYDHDGGLHLSERKKGNPSRPGGSAQGQAPQRADLVERRCSRCFMGAKRNRDLTISVGMHVYMAMPERSSLAPGHVILLPVEHTVSFREADDDTYEELKNFQKCLIQMFAEKGLSCIFFETALKVKESRTHACVDCVPVNSDAFASAPMMFRKEISESESEWSQHHAKSVIDTSEKGLRRCVPAKFPYFHVQYGYKRGTVHVIDNEQQWERGFGRSILVSLTGGKEVEMYRRAQRHDSETVQSQRAAFIRQWSSFDWTKQLE
eukprot:jgi/Ulvmu1/7569/UM037_0113.1